MGTVKCWLGGKKYELEQDIFDAMHEETAKYPQRQAEEKALAFLDKKGITPIGEEKKKKLIASFVLLALSAAAMVTEYFFPGDGTTHATVIGALITGAAVVTTFSGRDQCDAFLMLGDVDTAMPLSGLQVEVGGSSKINLTGSQPIMSAFAKYMMQLAGGGVVGLVIKIATGKILKTTTYKFTNNGATTPNIMAWSNSQTSGKKDNGQSIPSYNIEAATVGINALSYADFDKFTALMITPSANVATIDIDYEDGHRESGLTVLEVDAMLAMNSETEANGRLDAVVTTIDNRPVLGNAIKKVRVNATTAVTVAIIKLNDMEFKNAIAN